MPESSEQPQPYRIGVDIGGTFTDLIVVNSETGAFSIGKTLTTPDDPSRAVETAIAETLADFGVSANEVEHLIHGTTLVTNAMIERKGAKTALMTTAGFRDSIEIGKETRYDLYDLMLEQPKPIVPRYLRFDVPQRTLADGSQHTPLDEDFVRRLSRELADKGIEAVAVCFLHSFTNPNDERRVRELIHEVAPGLRVSISSDVVPEIREFERASTTIANVYVQELVERYLRKLEERLASLRFAGSFYLMLSSGGIATVDTTIRFPVRLLESGPAAGALAATQYGIACGHRDLISFDMGGTTAKICVIDDGKPLIAHEFEVDRIYRFKKGSGLPIKLPVIELIEIGTGGGSIARVDSLGLLKVGPDSAGADPGPVCYGRGATQPTVTDANLILGYLDPGYFLGGKMSLDVEAARAAIDTNIAKPLGMTIEDAAWGIHQIANENMANAARVHALERGKDPRRFPLFAFGGGGPVQAYRIALSLGSPQLIAPLGAGVMSTVGFLSAPLAFDFVRSWTTEIGELDWSRANELLEEMQTEGEDLLAASGVPVDDIVHTREADMRFVGQGHEIRVSLSADPLSAETEPVVCAEFDRVYRELYERSGPPVPIEITNWRVVSSGPKPTVSLRVEQSSNTTTASDARKGSRQAWFPESTGFVETAVYDRYALGSGMTFAGPAIVEERESTVIVAPGASCSIDENHNLVVDMPKSLADGLSIKVFGCVASPGRFKLPPSATVQQAIDAAGGFGGQGMQPTGVIAIRRKKAGGVEGIQLNRSNPSDLETTLEDRDTLVVQFDVDTHPKNDSGTAAVSLDAIRCGSLPEGRFCLDQTYAGSGWETFSDDVCEPDPYDEYEDLEYTHAVVSQTANGTYQTELHGSYSPEGEQHGIHLRVLKDMPDFATLESFTELQQFEAALGKVPFTDVQSYVDYSTADEYWRVCVIEDDCIRAAIVSVYVSGSTDGWQIISRTIYHGVFKPKSVTDS